MIADVQWVLFIVASLIVIITPGQDMVLVMSRSLAHGSLAGVATAAGVSTGLLGHTVLATLGLGALLQTADSLFLVLKLVGACYLIYLGMLLWRSGIVDVQASEVGPESAWRRFREGAVSNIANPKIAIFYFAYLPQFVPSQAPHATCSIFALGVGFALLTFLIKAPVGVMAGRLSQIIRARPRALSWLGRISGLTLIGLGLQLALSRR